MLSSNKRLKKKNELID